MSGVPHHALGNPEGGVVTGGSATIVSTADELQIHQSTDKALIEWSSFNIDAGETTRFLQPSVDAVALNRIVNSTQLSTINGNLIANGRIVIINPNGILIGANGNIDTASFLATTADIDDDAFLNSTGVMHFNRAGSLSAVIENQGLITIDEEGLAALVAPTVRNSGMIIGTMAKVQLAAADTFAVDLYGDGLIQFAVDPDSTSRTIIVENSGSIIADAGQVLMTAADASNVVDSVINSDGYIQAGSLENRNGRIILTAAGADITVSGTIDVSAIEPAAGGGTINIGGDLHGAGELALAKTATITDTAELYADAGDTSNGGEIVVWSEETTLSSGKYYARGGKLVGDGGIIETSAKEILDVTGTSANTMALGEGETGTWLLDPVNITVDATLATTINAAMSNVILDADNTITFQANVDIAEEDIGITALAGGGGISMSNSYIRTNGGFVTLDTDGAISLNGAGSQKFLFTRGGDIILVGDTVSINNAEISSGGGTIDITATADPNGNTKVVSINSTKIDTTGGGSVGSIDLYDDDPLVLFVGTNDQKEAFFGNTQNHFENDDNGGTFTISGENIGGNSNCFSTGGLTCLVTDPVAIDITIFADYQTKIYGDLDPLLTYTYDGVLSGGDFFTGVLIRDPGELVSSSPYNIEQGSLEISGSGVYTITYVGDVFEITPADLEITVDDTSKTYGDITTFNGDEFMISDGELFFSDTLTGLDISSLGAVNTANVGDYDIDGSNASGTGLDNYTITYVDGTLTVDPALLSITANDDSKVYDAVAYADGNGVIYSGFVNSENDSVLGGSLVFGGDSQGATNVGDYTITASGLTSGNYTISYFSGDLDITAAGLTITANSNSKTYGETFSFVGDEFMTAGLLGTDSVTSLNFSSTGAVNTADVGEYDIDGSNAAGTGLGNYTITYVDGTLTVDPALLSITANNDSKVYDALAYADGNGVMYSGFVNSEDDSDLDGALAYSGDSQGAVNVGSYTITPEGFTSGNYTISYFNGALDITAADLLIVTPDDISKTYGDTVVFAGTEFMTSGLLGLDSVDSVDLDSLGAVNTANVDEYDINSSNASGTGLGNYNISYGTGTLTVDPALLSITANDDSKVYDAVAYADGNGVMYSGFVNGENDSVLGGSLVFVGDSQGATNVGDYVITASGLVSGNYTISYFDGGLDITAAGLTITADNQLKTYGETFSFVGDEFMTAGLLGTDSVTSLTLSSLGSVNTANVGDYDIDGSNASGTGLGNYDITYVDGTLSVDPALLEVAADDHNKTYGALDPALTFMADGLQNGELAGDVFGGSLDRDSGENVGDYDITQGTLSLVSDNYTLSFEDGLLNITPADLEITADDASKDYGETLVFNGDEFMISDGELFFSDSLTGIELASDGAVNTANVDDYDITASNAAGTGLTNYNITYIDGTLSIDPALLEVAADDHNKTYGDADPTLSFTISGLQNGETSGDILNGLLDRDSGENVGDYDIEQGTLTLVSDNYTLDFEDGTLTITPATLFVSADPQSKIYGDTDPDLTFQVSGLKFSDTQEELLSGDLERDLGENVGDYDIEQGTLGLFGETQNYTLDFDPNILTITPATLLVSADQQSKFFGDVDPDLTFQVSGLKFSDTAEDLLVGELERDPGEDVGQYDILQGSLDLSVGEQDDYYEETSNYLLAFEPNILTIIGLAPEPELVVPLEEIDPLSRPIISVANQTIVLDESFEEIETLELETDVGIASTSPTTTPESLAGITPAAGETAESVAEIEPAAGSDAEEEEASDFEKDMNCGNSFLDNQPCDTEDGA